MENFTHHPTLSPIAFAFRVGLEYFFNDVRETCFPEAPEFSPMGFESLDFLATDREFNAYLADFHSVPTEKVRIHEHPGLEFLYVWNGKLALKVGANQGILKSGDSRYFDSQLPHGYSRAGTKPCNALAITAE